MLNKRKLNKEIKTLASQYTNLLSDIVDNYTPYEEKKLCKNEVKSRKRITVLVCVIVMVFSLTACACWKPISKFVYEVYEKYIEIIFVPDNTKYININDVQIDYIPDNFVLEIKDNMEDSIFYFYYNEANNINLSIIIENMDGKVMKGVDVENAEFVADPYRFIVNKDDYIILSICKCNVSVEITGRISTEEAVKIAQNIIF